MATKSEKEFLIRVRADIREAVRQLHNVSNETQRTGKAASQASRGVKGLGSTFDFLTRAAAAYLTLKTATYVIRQADAFNVLQQRIKTATKETGDYSQVSKELFDISQANGVALENTVSLFQNLARTAPELNATNDQVLTLTNLVQQLGVISGATQTQLAAGLLQFSQGLAGGIFRAEEFNSIVENLPEVASRIAKGMGTTVGQLRRAVINGKVLSKDVFDALLKQAGDINEEFQNIDTSVARQGTSLSNAFDRFLGKLDQAASGTGTLAKVMQLITKSLENWGDYIGESELEAATREKAKLVTKYNQLRTQIEGSFNRANAAMKLENNVRIQALLQQIDEVDAKIIRLNKAALKAQENADKAGQGNDNAAKPNPQQSEVDKVIDKLKQQQREMDLTKNEAALLDLNLLHASDSEIQFARSVVDAIDAHKKQQAVMEEGKKIYEETRTAQEKLAAQLAHLDELYANGAFGKPGTAKAVDTYARAVFDAQDAVEGLGKTGKNTFDELVAAARGWGQEFSDTIAKMVVDGKANFKDLADSIVKELIRILVYQQITKPVLGYFGVGVKHDGGVVGQGGGSSRQVSPLAFAGAQRFHTGGMVGLRPDEVPIIAQKGEVVIPKNQVGRGGGGGDINVRSEVINHGSPKQGTRTQARFDGKELVISTIIEDIDVGGAFSQALQDNFKVARRS